MTARTVEPGVVGADKSVPALSTSDHADSADSKRIRRALWFHPRIIFANH